MAIFHGASAVFLVEVGEPFLIVVRNHCTVEATNNNDGYPALTPTPPVPKHMPYRTEKNIQ